MHVNIELLSCKKLFRSLIRHVLYAKYRYSKIYEYGLNFEYIIIFSTLHFILGLLASWPQEASSARGRTSRGRGQDPRGRGRGRGQDPRGRSRGQDPRGRGRGRGQVFWPRGRGQASRLNIPAKIAFS